MHARKVVPKFIKQLSALPNLHPNHTGNVIRVRTVERGEHHSVLDLGTELLDVLLVRSPHLVVRLRYALRPIHVNVVPIPEGIADTFILRCNPKHAVFDLAVVRR